MSRLRRVALAVPPVRRLVDDRDRWRRRATKAAAERDRAVASAEIALAGAARDDLGYLFVVTYGRSGSTLLLGLLNAIPGYDLRGENGGALHALFRYHRTLVSRHAKHATKKLTARHPWYGLDEFSAAESLAALRGMVVATLLRPAADTRVTGFKEIRWWHDDALEYLAFLQELFPGARFVINTRNHADVAKSKWWADREDPLAVLARYEAQLDAMERQLGAAAYRVHYDDYVADHGVLAGLYAWLGEAYDRETVDAVMEVRHSY